MELTFQNLFIFTAAYAKCRLAAVKRLPSFLVFSGHLDRSNIFVKIRGFCCDVSLMNSDGRGVIRKIITAESTLKRIKNATYKIWNSRVFFIRLQISNGFHLCFLF